MPKTRRKKKVEVEIEQGWNECLVEAGESRKHSNSRGMKHGTPDEAL